MENTSSVVKQSGKAWLVTEKIIGTLLIIWGIVVLFSVVNTTYYLFDKTYIALAQTTNAQIISKAHPSAILSIVCIFSGFLLLFADKRGWLLSLVSSLTYAIILGVSSKSRAADSTLLYSQFYKSYGAVALVFGIIFILLLMRYFREKYHVTARNFLWVFVIIALIIADNMLFR